MSSFNAQNRAVKSARGYKLGKRADKQAETRARIVEATLALHSNLGPARTTVSQIAERAGVQRHTVYAHFPDDRSLFLACSGLALERNPLPDPVAWATSPPGGDRLRIGLGALYGWFERNAEMAACVLRDAEDHALTGEMIALRMAPTFAEAAAVLGEGLSERQRALLAVALDFACWRNLALPAGAAAALMSDAVAGLA